jgi:hypothetical protein
MQDRNRSQNQYIQFTLRKTIFWTGDGGSGGRCLAFLPHNKPYTKNTIYEAMIAAAAIMGGTMLILGDTEKPFK